MLCLYGLDAGVVGILAATASFNERYFVMCVSVFKYLFVDKGLRAALVRHGFGTLHRARRHTSPWYI